MSQKAIVRTAVRAIELIARAEVGVELRAGAARLTLAMVIASVAVFVYVPCKLVGAPDLILSIIAVTAAVFV